VLNADQHPISYQIEIGDTDSYRFTDETHDHGSDDHEPAYDIAFSQYSECERFATKNRDCPTRSVLGYVEDQQELDDVVSWVAVGFHHVVRDEDQSPMDLHWQGFTLLPRDLTAQRADLPKGRAEVNGKPDSGTR
jgi:primary-amine oxidase